MREGCREKADRAKGGRGTMTVDNPNPVVHAVQTDRKSKPRPVVTDEDEGAREPFCAGELFDLIRDIIDPEHPYTLEQLKVVRGYVHPRIHRPPCVGASCVGGVSGRAPANEVGFAALLRAAAVRTSARPLVLQWRRWHTGAPTSRTGRFSASLSSCVRPNPGSRRGSTPRVALPFQCMFEPQLTAGSACVCVCVWSGR